MGLSPAAPFYGKSLLSVWGSQWSYYTGLYEDNLTQLIVGQFNSTFLNTGNTLKNYSLTSSSSWSIAISQLSYNSTNYMKNTSSSNSTNEIQYAKFDFTNDTLIIPNNTYKNLTSIFQSKVKGLICNSTSTTQCYYNGICSDISSSFSPLSF